MNEVLNLKIKKCLYNSIFILIMLLGTFYSMYGCNAKKDDNKLPNKNKKSQYVTVKEKTKKILSKMTLEEKIGQLFIVKPETLCPSIDYSPEKGVTKINDEIVNNINKCHIGGIILFSKNIKNEKQLKSFINDLQSSSKYKLFISVDEEGGLVSRVANCDAFHVKKYKNIQSIGNTNNESKAKELGSTIGSYLKPLGFNLDFAPVADINTNPKNPIIGVRSYGNNAELVSRMVNAQLDGMHKAGIMGCTKHYPGHGDTSSDTHTGSVSINKTWDELKKCEIIPFASSFNKTDMIMASHIIANNASHDKLPTSISKNMIQEKLRNELGYKGVVISDSMEMKAISDHYNSAESATLAIKSGVDIVLMSPDIQEAYDAVLNSVKKGEISIERIDESVTRILELKVKYNMII